MQLDIAPIKIGASDAAKALRRSIDFRGQNTFGPIFQPISETSAYGIVRFGHLLQLFNNTRAPDQEPILRFRSVMIIDSESAAMSVNVGGIFLSRMSRLIITYDACQVRSKV